MTPTTYRISTVTRTSARKNNTNNAGEIVGNNKKHNIVA